MRSHLGPITAVVVSLCQGVQSAQDADLTPAEANAVLFLLHLDEAHGEQARDASFEQFPVEARGAEAGGSGRFGAALAFDGVDAHARVNGNFCLARQTVELWVKPAANEGGGILSSQENPGQSHWRWRLARNADQTVSFHIWDGAQKDEPVRTVQSKIPVPAGQWTHLAVTIDTRQAREAVLYVNGNREGSAHVKTNVPYGSLFLGTSTVEHYFAGLLDEIAIFDVVLPAERIAAHAAANGPFRTRPASVADSILMRPIGDTTWFAFRHPDLPGWRWTFRMPEYMAYDSARGRHGLPRGVCWQASPDRTRLALSLDLDVNEKRELCLDFNGNVTAYADHIDYELTVRNPGETGWEKMQMSLFCLQCFAAPGFVDHDAERTFVRQKGKWITMNEIVKGEFAEHRMCGVGVHRGKGAGAERLAARVSADGTWVLGIATDIANSLSFNFQDRAACLHSNPSWGLLAPGREITAHGKIYLFRGDLDDLWRRYCTDFGAAPAEGR